MRTIAQRRTVAVVGTGAAGTMVAVHLLQQAAVGQELDVVLIGPAHSTGHGVAYSTRHPGHLLNVAAGKMSARPDDPGHFVRWLSQQLSRPVSAGEYVARRHFGRYLADVLDETARNAKQATLIRVDDRVVRATRHAGGLSLGLASGADIPVAAAVLALGSFAPGRAWAPDGLLASSRFIADPWAPGALASVSDEQDILIVGTGLTMADVVLALDRPGRVIHAVSRHGMLPRAHSAKPVVTVEPPELGGDLASLRAGVRGHLASCVRAHGDWRPAFDSLRPLTQSLWQRLSDADRRCFMVEDGRRWEVHRHRMAPDTAARLARIRKAGRLRIWRDEVLDAAPGLCVRLRGGQSVRAHAVINCTGAEADLRNVGDALVDQLFAMGLAHPGPLGLGLDTADDGRVLPTDAPLWTLGSLRRGNLWETTAFAEIRTQAADVAAAVLSAVREMPGQSRPRDRYGLTLSTTAETAKAYDKALERILCVQGGATEAIQEAVAMDPGFAVGQAALALLGHEWGAEVHVPSCLRAAQQSVRRRGDDRERSFVFAVAEWIDTGNKVALLRHIEDYPRDAFAVSVAVPTIAFGGVTNGRDTWELVERLGSAYGTDWWYSGQLAFVRQEQGRLQEAESLAARALAEQPASGHAVHARAHVFYETGQHTEGLAWLDAWIRDEGPQADNRAHFSWHAALHELLLGDNDAVRRRYASQLAPPTVTGARALVDSASLLWRCHVRQSWDGPLPVDRVLEVSPQGWLAQPPNAFAAMHTAVALAAAGDTDGLARLRLHAQQNHAAVVFPRVVAPLCAGLSEVVSQRWSKAIEILEAILPTLPELGGSAAQRDVIEDTLLYAMMSAGRNIEAAKRLSARLDT